MERRLWRKKYGSLTLFPCPRCNNGKLRIQQKTLALVEPQHVKSSLQDMGLTGVCSEGRFTVLLECNFGFCGEIVAISGDYMERYEVLPDEYDESGYHTITDRDFYPKAVIPALPIISWPTKLNRTTAEHLLRAFGLFWNDRGACANRLRIFVEVFLDDLGIPRKGKRRNGKTGDLDLSERIDALDMAKPGHSKALNALRFVGNTGSHDGDVDFDDLLDCFELLEDVLVELVDERRAKLEAKADAIISRKGRPKAP